MGVRQADVESENLIAVDIQVFRNATRDIGFDVYLKLSDDNVAHVFSRATGLDYRRLAGYVQKGVQSLHIRREDVPAFELFRSRPAHVIFNDPEVAQEKKVAALLNMTEQNMAELFAQVQVAPETAEGSKRVVQGYVDLMTHQPQSLATLLKLVSHGEYLYYHSIAVAVFSLFIAKATGKFDKTGLETIGLGGFLHDIGCTQLPREIVCSPTDLTETQWSEMHRHTEIGLKMLESAPQIPKEARYIVYQHHEEPGGKGYPNGLKGDAIFYPAKIVALADAFSALVSKRPFRPALSVEETLRILHERPDKFDSQLLSIIDSIFLRQPQLSKAA